jgi:hypothetical protein
MAPTASVVPAPGRRTLSLSNPPSHKAAGLFCGAVSLIWGIGDGLADRRRVAPDERRILLALPPHIREELLQGEKLEGPEAYQRFIRDYSRQLLELQKK